MSRATNDAPNTILHYILYKIKFKIAWNSEWGAETAEGMSCLLTETHPVHQSHTRPVPTCLNVCLTKWAYSVKICSLAQRFPELKSHRSCDLSPASCISVAWYGGWTGSLLYMLGLFSVGMVAQRIQKMIWWWWQLARVFSGTWTPTSSPTNSSPHSFQVSATAPKPTTASTCAPVMAMWLPMFAMASSKVKAAAWTLGWRDQGRVPRVGRRCLAQAGSSARTTRIIAASPLDGVLADGDHSV